MPVAVIVTGRPGTSWKSTVMPATPGAAGAVFTSTRTWTVRSDATGAAAAVPLVPRVTAAATDAASRTRRPSCGADG